MRTRGRPRKAGPRKGDDYEKKRFRIIEVANAREVTQMQLAVACGVSQVTISRFMDGRARLTDAQMADCAKYLDNAPTHRKRGGPQSLADIAEFKVPQLEEMLAELKDITGDIPPEEAENPLRYLARKHAPAIFGQALRLMLAAPSMSVRADMVKFLTERGFGRAPQSDEHSTPKPPMEDQDFLEALGRAIDTARRKEKENFEKAEKAAKTKPVPPSKKAELDAEQLAH